MQNRALGAVLSEHLGSAWLGRHQSTLRSVGLCTVAWENPDHEERFCMLNIKVLVGLISVIAHHFKVINSWSPRSDCSLALRSATMDMRAWMYLCSRSSQPPLFLLPIVQHLSSFCCTFQPPVPCSYSWFGVAHWKGAKAHATTKWKGEEMFWHSPGPSSPLCYTGIAEGWCPGEDWELLGERFRSWQGGNI